MPLTAQNSEEQAMLDLMELRGFSLVRDRNGRQFMLCTPDGVGYAIMQTLKYSVIEMAFSMFQQINHHYP
jgi:hypothetical protein